MRTTKLMNGLLAFALVGLAFSALVPTAAAQAQDPTLTIELASQGGDQLLKPLQSPITLRGEVTFTADTLSPRSQVTGILISLEKVSAPGWATVVFNPPQIALTLEQAGADPQTSKSESFEVLISASDQAPAFQEAEIKIQAKSSSNSFVNAKTASTTASIRASYFSILDVALPETIKVERPQTPVTFPISVTNLGNGPTKVNFEMISELAEGDKMQIIPPQSQTLESRQTGGSAITKDAVLQVQTPYKNGYLNEPRSVTVKLNSHYATDSTLAGASEQVTVLVTTKGFYVPGPSPIILVGLLGIAAIVFRQLRK